MLSRSVAAAILLALISTSAAAQWEQGWYCESSDGRQVAVRWTDTQLGRQKLVAVVLATETQVPRDMVVFVHGDSPFGDPVYQYEVARKIAEYRPGTVAVSILRPGYSDDCGHASSGDAGRKMGDNYTQDVVLSLASTIRSEARQWRPRRTIVLGHSGGAALAALLASIVPDVPDRSVLIACPCDLAAWRTSMAGLTGNDRWFEPMSGLSPVAFVEQLGAAEPLELWVGSEDVVTPPALTENYAAAGRHAGKNISFNIVAGGDHDLVLDDDALQTILSSIFD